MINSISQEQETLILKYQQKWLQIGLKTEQTDYQKIKEQVTAIYALIGLKEPNILLVDSPYQALKQIVCLDESSNKIGQDLIHKKINFFKLRTRLQMDEELWIFLRRQLLNGLIDLFLDSLEIPFWNLLEEKLEIELDNRWDKLITLLWVEKKLQAHNEFEPSTEFYFNGFSSWANISEACICDFCISVLNCEHNLEEWKILKNLINYCGWIFPYDNICIISSHPSIIRLDEQNNIHGEGVPAIQFNDGFSVYANHGTILVLE